jgi:hypothetical protein
MPGTGEPRCRYRSRRPGNRRRGGGDDALYQLVGVGRPRPVVPLGVDSERLCYLPQLVRQLFDRHGFDVYTTKPRPYQGPVEIGDNVRLILPNI